MRYSLGAVLMVSYNDIRTLMTLTACSEWLFKRVSGVVHHGAVQEPQPVDF